MVYRFLIFLAVSSFFHVESSLAVPDQDKENITPRTPPSSPKARVVVGLSPYSKVDNMLSPARNDLACLITKRGSVSPGTIAKVYRDKAPEFVEQEVWFNLGLLDLSDDRMEKGRNPKTYKGEPIEVHHLFQTNESILALLPRSLHRSLDRKILVERDPLTKSTRVVKTRLSRQKALLLKACLERENPHKEYLVISNALHPYRDHSLIDRKKFNTQRSVVLRGIHKKWRG